MMAGGYNVVSPGDLLTGSGQEGVCGYLAVCRSLGLTRMSSEGGQQLYYNPQLPCALSSL